MANKADKELENVITGKKATPVAALDLFNFETKTASNKGVRFVIPHPVTGEPTATVFILRGLDSAEYLEFQDAESKEAQTQAIALMAAIEKNKKPTVQPAKSTVDQNVDRLVILTIGWENVKWGGNDLPFTPENARKVYDSVPAIRAAVLEFVRDETHFFQVSQQP